MEIHCNPEEQKTHANTHSHTHTHTHLGIPSLMGYLDHWGRPKGHVKSRGGEIVFWGCLGTCKRSKAYARVFRASAPRAWWASALRAFPASASQAFRALTQRAQRTSAPVASRASALRAFRASAPRAFRASSPCLVRCVAVIAQRGCCAPNHCFYNGKPYISYG